jgi:hypothetical protein
VLVWARITAGVLVTAGDGSQMGGATEDNIVVLSVLKTGTRYIVPTGFTGLISGLVLVGHTQAWDQ